MYGIIYKAISPSGKCYVGKTVSDLANRKRQHKHDAYTKKDGKYKYDYKFCRAIRKYGFENFKWQVLHDNVEDLNLLSKLEEEEIKKMQSCKIGYNIETSSRGGPRSEETKRKISKSLMGHKPFGGPSMYWSGKSRSKETKRKISETMKRKGINPHNYRKKK